ncbi:S26 family signal peptidase [Bosea lathyri]|uniref:Conjugative transfer signal peptidase TraF n=1 Tax=Bosea lathyri TaxID=1036778 RepID=A0A1H6CWM1_9HYPH|nr:S26 family signal peptidase [Bosea lathyri]SEG76786.1 conjugative transfer signal peptidase TraF [Bosea lathyri]
MKRTGFLFAAVLGALGVCVPAITPMPIKLIWNASASAPVGFYTTTPADALEMHELVAVMPPAPLAHFMVGRGYVGPGVPLLKRVLGLPGQRVCRTGRTVTVDGVEMGDALERDRMGRELLVWRGCRTIAQGELFLMNRGVSDSFDGRYFGPLPAAAVIGRALPLFTDEDGDGRFVWRARTR